MVRKGGFEEPYLVILLFFIDLLFESTFTSFLQLGVQRVWQLALPKDSCTVSKCLKIVKLVSRL